MQARPFVLAALLLGTASAHAQYGGMMNPMTMMNPMAMMNPMSMMNPMGMMAPMTMMAAPMMMPMGAGMMSAPMYNPQAMMNPYLNPMAAGNPYMNSGAMMNPFGMMQPGPAYGGGYGAPTQAAPMPFFPAAPVQPAPAMPFFPMMPAAPGAAAPAPQSIAPAGNPFDPTMWMQMMGGMTPAAPAQEPAK